MLLRVHDRVSCLFLSVFQAPTNLAAAWGQNHEFGNHSRAGGGSPERARENRVLRWLADARPDKGPSGGPRRYTSTPLVWCDRESVQSRLDISRGKRQPGPHHPSSSLAGRARAPPTTSGRPSVPANPPEAWARKAVLSWSEVTCSAWLAAESAETLGGGWGGRVGNGSDGGCCGGSGSGGGRGSGSVRWGVVSAAGTGTWDPAVQGQRGTPGSPGWEGPLRPPVPGCPPLTPYLVLLALPQPDFPPPGLASTHTVPDSPA